MPGAVQAGWLIVAVAIVVVAVAVGAPVAPAVAVPMPGPVPGSDQSFAPDGGDGWTRTFVDSFLAPIDTGIWGRYDGQSRASAISHWSRENVRTEQSTGSGGQGHLLITTMNSGGEWTSGGLSSARGVARVQGQWLVRARFDRAPGIGYAFLLYPLGGGWPPEVDFAEGTAGTTTELMAALHYGQENTKITKTLDGYDITQWHTYGVIMFGDRISFVIDGEVWWTFEHPEVPDIPLWLGMQANAKPYDGNNREWVGSDTPQNSSIDVDWVAHYEYTGQS